MVTVEEIIFPAVCHTGASLPIGWEGFILRSRPLPENPKDSNAEENGHGAQHQSQPQVHVSEKEMISQSLSQRQCTSRMQQGHDYSSMQ